MRILITVFLLLTFSFSAIAKNLLITDVDDTIKDSRVRDRWEMIKRGPMTGPEMVIPGMQEALKHLIAEKDISAMYYVSKIPGFLDSYHQEFLESNEFPPGIFYSRGWTTDFKFKTITMIIEQEMPSKVILIGDNGESDAQVFKRIVEHFEGSEIQFDVRIRLAYADNFQLEEGQLAFLEGRDLVESFSKQSKMGLLSKLWQKTKSLCRKAL